MNSDPTSAIPVTLEVNTPFFRVGKVWQWDEHSLLIQLMPANRLAQAIGKKLFLALKVHPQHFGVTIVGDKPQIPDRLTTPAQLLRKYLGGAMLLSVKQDQATANQRQVEKSDMVLEFSLGKQLSERSWLLMTCRDGGLMELVIPPAKSVLRFGGKGCFTKPKDYESTEMPLGQNPVTMNLLPELYREIAGKAGQHEAKASPALAVDSVTAALRQKFKRRLRSLLKAREKNLALQQQSREAEELLHKARLLQQYGYLIKPDAIELRLSPEQTGLATEVVAELDPELSVGGNIEACFVKAKKLQRTALQCHKQLEKIDHDISRVEQYKQHLSEGVLSTNQQMQKKKEKQYTRLVSKTKS